MTDSDATQGDNMSPAEFAKLMGAYPQPAENPLPTYGGYMDNSAANFSWVQNNDYFGAEEYSSSELEQMDEGSIQGVLFSIIQENGLEDEYCEMWEMDDLSSIVEQYGYKDAIDEIMEIQIKAKSAESEEKEMMDLLTKGKVALKQFVAYDDRDFKDFCKEEDLDYNDPNALQEYVETYDDVALIEMLKDDEQGRYYELKESFGAETEGWVLYSPRMGRSGVFTTKDDAEKVKNWYMGNAPPHYNIENTMKIVPANANDDELDNRSKQILLVGMRYDAENMSPQVFGKLVGQYPQPPNNPLPVGGFMDEGFEWTVNQAENEDGWFAVSYVSNEKQAKNELRELEERAGDYKGRYEYKIKENPDKKGWSVLARSIFSMESEDYYCTKCDEGFSSITPTDEGQFCNNCLPDSATPHNEMDAATQKEEFGSSNIVSKVKNNWLNGLVGLGLGLVAFDFVKKKGYVANADTLIEGPNTGDLTPADYEEIVVESTGYAVPIIPVSLDGSFMGSRFHALPTDRYVYDSPEGIGAHSDVAMKRNTTFLPNEMSLVQASEAPGQSPYNSILPNGQENKDFPLRVIHETTTVSLDPSTAPFIPTDMSGYTGQQFIPTSVYEDMLGVGISGKIPSFSQPASGDIGSNHFGSRIANPDMLTNVGGPLQEDVNGDYTDGSITKSLSQWSIENQVQQISDTEAIVVERGSGGRKMIRRV